MLSRFHSWLFTLAVVALGVTSVAAHPPWGIVVSSTGIVYFSDLETVWKIDREGNLSVFRPGNGGHHVHELSIDVNDNVYGPDYGYEAASEKYYLGVWKMTPNGEETYLQPPIDSFMSGVSIWRDRAGNMYSIEQNNHTKVRTLLLRRTPAGVVSTLAGGAYGQVDGRGAAAKFGSVTAMTVGPDENIYLTDDAGIRRVTLDGDVTTIATDVTARTAEDKATLFGANDKNLFGLAVDAGGNVYVADAGNRRLVKVSQNGKLSVVYRVDPPYFPTGVFVTATGDVYVLEFSYTPPGTTDRPRVRKLSTDGKNALLARNGVANNETISASGGTGGSTFRKPALVNRRVAFIVLVLTVGLIAGIVFAWRRSHNRRGI
jgi:hypothetical protein